MRKDRSEINAPLMNPRKCPSVWIWKSKSEVKIWKPKPISKIGTVNAGRGITFFRMRIIIPPIRPEIADELP